MQCFWAETDNPDFNRLMNQFVERVGRNARGGKIEARKGKYLRYKVFLEFISERFAPDDIKNIQPKHVASFVRHRRAQGWKESTILKDLAVIRWWHVQILWRKFEIPENSQIFILEERLDEKSICEEFKKRYLRKKGS